jgi:hypothetical protein
MRCPVGRGSSRNIWVPANAATDLKLMYGKKLTAVQFIIFLNKSRFYLEKFD